jgi:preprotein translocase subunit YajC
MLMTLFLLAEAADQAADPGANQPQGGLFTMLLPLLPIFLLFWLLMIRPARKQEAQRKAMLASLEKDDRVLTTGGIIGWVVSVQDDEVTVRIAENVKVKVVRSGIAQNLTKLEAASQPQGATDSKPNESETAIRARK